MASKQKPANGDRVTTVTLTEGQCAYIRQLLFEELNRAAEILTDQAAGAAQGNVNSLNVDGDDAASTFRDVQVVAGLLDMMGWSVENDTATLIELERKRRSA